MTDAKQRDMIRSRIEKSDEKIQSLALLMLHYCAGLQHCLDQQEAERQRLLQDHPGTTPNGTNEGQQEEGAVGGAIVATTSVGTPVAIGQDAVEIAESFNGHAAAKCTGVIENLDEASSLVKNGAKLNPKSHSLTTSPNIPHM